MGSYLAHGPKIYPKAHENPRVFSYISGPIFLESPSHGSSDGSFPWENCITGYGDAGNMYAAQSSGARASAKYFKLVWFGLFITLCYFLMHRRKDTIIWTYYFHLLIFRKMITDMDDNEMLSFWKNNLFIIFFNYGWQILQPLQLPLGEVCLLE